jgi:hypothetical protein
MTLSIELIYSFSYSISIEYGYDIIFSSISLLIDYKSSTGNDSSIPYNLIYFWSECIYNYSA